MVTKGIIKGKSTQESNKYLVRIPIFESAGIGESSSSLNSSIVECTLSHSPGTFEGLKEGDVVFVSFEDNKFSKPVILGKLYTKIEEDSSVYQISTSLKVTEKATLPANTTIGNVDFSNINNYFNSINDFIETLRNSGYDDTLVQQLINDLSNGTFVVERANQTNKDGSGRIIDSTYLSDISLFNYDVENQLIHLIMDSPAVPDVIDVNIELPLVSTDFAGLMSKEDKTKLDTLDEGGFGVNIIRLV